MSEATEFLDNYGSAIKIPQVGDGATYGVGSDSYPATVTNVWTEGRKVHVSIRGDEYSYNRETGEETFTPNPRCPEKTYRLEKGVGCHRNKEYDRNAEFYYWNSVHHNRDTGRWNKGNTRGGIGFNGRRYHMDPHF